jgi:hypothetical protein
MAFHRLLRRSFATAVAAAMLLARPVLGQTSVLPDASSVGVTRFELQRTLLDIDEQRRRLELSLEPVDSVLRLLASDTARVATMKRSPLVDQNAARVRSLVHQLRVYPGSPELTTRLISAVTTTTHDFSAADNTLSTRVLIGSAAQDVLARSPNADVVSIDQQLPPYDTPLWEKIRQSDYGKQRLAPITDDDLLGFQASISEAGFESYKGALLSALTRRMAEIRQTRDASRADVVRLRRRAAELAHTIGSQDDGAAQFDLHLVNVALPVFAVVLLILFLGPRVYSNPELQYFIFASGLLLEITTLVLVTGTVLVLGLGGKIHAEVIGTMLGALSGFVLGRAVPRRAADRQPMMTPAPASAPPPAPTRPGRFR